MAAILVASGQNSGALGTVTAVTTNPIPQGSLVMVLMTVAAAALQFATVTENSGSGTVFSLTQIRNGVVGQDGVLAIGIAAGPIPTGTTFVGTLVSGAPGGRMFSIAYFNDTLRTPSPPIIDFNNVTAVAGSSNPIANGTPTTFPELIVFIALMVSSTAGGALDSITLDGSLTQIDNRNHTGSATRYMAWGYRSIGNANPINDSATLQASDSTLLDYIAVELPAIIPPPPGNLGGRLLILKV
jgi:hypothetical protein